MMLALLIREYGIIMIGFVGSAKKGCEAVDGDFAASGGL
jgi:hypothetical protein